MKESGRPYLDWYIDDGWTPLCRFLGKDVPDVEIPRGNAVGKEFNDKAGEYIESLVKAATVRMALAIAITVGPVAVLWRQL